MKSTGDGMLALFDRPGDAVRCARQLVAAAAGLGVEIRAGAHTGEVEIVGDDVAGLAVHIAARVASLGEATEVIVSRTVRDLVIGSEHRFEDRGTHTLKGVPEEWQVFSLSS